MTKQEIIIRINSMLDVISELIKTKGLACVPTESYNMRESGDDMIYFSKGTWVIGERYLVPSPTVKQKLYKDFFSETGENKVLPKYALYVYEDHIEFTERVILDGKAVKKNLRTS